MFTYDRDYDFNRYINLDTLEGRIVYTLVNSRSQHALDLWNMLEYNTADCLNHIDDYFQQPTIKERLGGVKVTLLTTESDFAKMLPAEREVCKQVFEEAWEAEISKRWKMVYLETDEASNKKVFLYPFVDDAWTERATRLDIYVDDIIPENQVISTVLVGVDIVIHNKIINMDNPVLNDNPAEMNGEDIICTVKSRVATMLKSVLAELNGLFVAGVGLLQANTTANKKCGVKRVVWNNRSYIGHQIIFATQMSGASSTPNVGY